MTKTNSTTRLPTSSPPRDVEEIAEQLKEVLLSDPSQLRKRFGKKPITFLRIIDPNIRFPKKLRILFALLWTRQDLKGRPFTRIIIKGPRGGGKSYLLGAYGFVDWFFNDHDVVD